FAVLFRAAQYQNIDSEYKVDCQQLHPIEPLFGSISSRENRPYIRYQYFDTEQREKAQQIFQHAHIRFTKRTNAWVPFVIASISHLLPGGRLAMVVPAELLYIDHAKGLRLWLEQEMERIHIIHLREIVFSKTLQGVVLLLAEKRSTRSVQPLHTSPGKHQASFLHDEQAIEPINLHIYDVENIDSLQQVQLMNGSFSRLYTQWEGQWMKALLSDKELSLLEHIWQHPKVRRFDEIADVDIGIVTGANKFFVVDDTTLHRYRLEQWATPMLAKSDLIQGISYRQSDHEFNAQSGKSVHFLQFPTTLASGEMTDYIRLGELQGLHTRYKCRIRDPWYVVPYVWVSEISLLKRAHHYPRLVLNQLGAHSTDTAYRIKLHPAYQGQAKNMVASFLNSFTFLFAELLGRHYGGGVLELVPSEIEQLPVPLVHVCDEQFETIDQMIRSGISHHDLVNKTDALILQTGLGIDIADIEQLRCIHKKLMNRRLRKRTK
ncbi:MAG: hypothetical protein AAF639_45110, partial [Chloroflexota bacterium]